MPRPGETMTNITSQQKTINIVLKILGQILLYTFYLLLSALYYVTVPFQFVFSYYSIIILVIVIFLQILIGISVKFGHWFVLKRSTKRKFWKFLKGFYLVDWTDVGTHLTVHFVVDLVFGIFLLWIVLNWLGRIVLRSLEPNIEVETDMEPFAEPDISNSTQEYHCTICMEFMHQKMGKTKREKRFAMLENCDHIFCAECIREWYKELKRDCPNCRVVSPRYLVTKRLIRNRIKKRMIFNSALC